MNARTLPAALLTEGALNALARTLRAALSALENQPQRPYRDDLTAVLSALDFEVESTHDGWPALYFASEQDKCDALVEITAKLIADEPRKWRRIQSVMHVEGRCVWWGLERWVEETPYGSAA